MPRRSETVTDFLAHHISAGAFPSAVYLVAERGQVVFEDATGLAVVTPEAIPASTATIYDVASLTKPLVTGLLSAIAIERGILSLGDPVSRLLTEFSHADKQAITIEQVLTHTSGMSAWLPLYKKTQGERGRALEVIARHTLEAPPGEEVIYSDLGFIALGFLIERLFGDSLASVAAKEIFRPIGLTRTFFNPPAALRREIAASESGNEHERQTAAESSFGGAGRLRDSLIWGEVHDGNACFLGGAAGHAGLFSAAREVFRIAQQFMSTRTELLRAETCRLFTGNLTSGLKEARSVAWQLASTPDSTAGPMLPQSSFGHLGFTGTSCWIDHEHDRVYVLLTNRTHMRRPPFVNINSIRRGFHSLAAAALSSL